MRNNSAPDRTPAGDERGSISTLTSPPEITSAERAVADLLPIGADPEAARRVLERVPLWFHTFALNPEHGLYTPGRGARPPLPGAVAAAVVRRPARARRRHVRRLLRLPGRAPRRGARVAVDNEQYVAWVKARWGIELRGRRGLPRDRRAARLARRVRARRRAHARGHRRALRRDLLLRDPAPRREPARPAARARRPAGPRRPPAGGDLRDRRRRPPRATGRSRCARPAASTPATSYVYWGFGAGGLSALATPGRLRATRRSTARRRSTGIRASWRRSCAPARDQAARHGRGGRRLAQDGRPVLVTASGRSARRRFSNARPSRSSRSARPGAARPRARRLGGSRNASETWG